MAFREVSPKQSFPKLEEDVLHFWNEKRIFERSVNERPEEDSYTFYDGPPFATGLPHYGHILTSIIKDVVPRYQTMKGKRVERRFGWDCHGLPIENIIEKKLDLGNRQAIEAFGVDKFNEECRSVVLQYTKEWEETITRIGRWVDFENDFKTMDPSYMESLWWVFQQLWEKGLIYEGHKSLPYCYRCATPLSNFEAGLDDSYRMKQDPSVTVQFTVKDQEHTTILAWTTTPWTLPGNMALAVSPDLVYVKISDGEQYIVLAKERFDAYAKDLSDFTVVEEFTGSHMENWRYEPLFPYYADKVKEGAFQVVLADFVTATDGTGVVHIAPGFGEDDHELAMAKHIPVVVHVDDTGAIVDEATDFAGMNVHDANHAVIDWLKSHRSLLKHETIDHNYPHCWRCDTPLIYRAISTWFVRVTDVKQRLLDANARITWVPEYVGKGIFHNWLEGARDWAISRSRYWGTPLPVWRCDDCHATTVVGSIADLEKRTGTVVKDLHKHFVDELTFPCDVCDNAEARQRRVPEVLDCWFESGSMPYAQLHYPFENAEQFERSFPADFITEYVGQTRGWFYTLTILAAALYDKPSFLNAVVHGIVLAEDGRKMSKRLQNYPDPTEVLNKYGADALRLYVMSSAVVKGDDLRFSERDLSEMQRRVLLTLWNTYSFFVTYANVDGWEPPVSLDDGWKPTHILDRWILSELQVVVRELDTHFTSNDLLRAARVLPKFVDDLSNWYVRRSRRRFWKSDSDVDKNDAYRTLWQTLVVLSRAVAPLIPFMAEEMYRNLTATVESAKDSVHLDDFPTVMAEWHDVALSDQMADIRRAVLLGRQARDAAQIKVRQPLAGLRLSGFATTFTDDDLAIIKDELNVESVVVVDSLDDVVQRTVLPVFSVLGPRVGANMGAIQKALANGDFTEQDDHSLVVGDEVVKTGEYEVRYESSDERWSVAGHHGAVVALDTEISDELRLWGVVRDILRVAQELRKEAELSVSDHIVVGIVVEQPDVRTLLEGDAHALVMKELLADRVEFQELDSYDVMKAYEIDDVSFVVSLRRA